VNGKPAVWDVLKGVLRPRLMKDDFLDVKAEREGRLEVTERDMKKKWTKSGWDERFFVGDDLELGEIESDEEEESDEDEEMGEVNEERMWEILAELTRRRNARMNEMGMTWEDVQGQNIDDRV
jgi:hypothetical protein